MASLNNIYINEFYRSYFNTNKKRPPWTSHGQALSGLRVDGPLGRRFLRGLSLTRLWREGCGERPYGRQYKCCLAAAGKTVQPPCGRGNAIPLWWLAPPPSPHFVVGLWMLSHGAMSLQESIERFILPPLAGEVRRSRIGGGERSEPIGRLLIMPYDTESQFRNADFISIALRVIRNPRGQRPRQTLEPLGRRPIHLKNLFPQPFYTTRGVSRAPFYKTCGEAATTTLGPKGRQT